MKKVYINEVTDSAQLPGIVKVLDHVQQSYSEVFNSFINTLIPYTTGQVIILYGCTLTGTDPGSRTITAGAIYYNGEIYLVDALSFTTSGSNIPVWTLIESFPSGTVEFTDGTMHSVFAVRKFVIQEGPIGGSGIANYICDYNSSVVNYSLFGKALITSATPYSGQVLSSGTAVFTGVTYFYRYRIVNGLVYMNFIVIFTGISSGAWGNTIKIPMPFGIQQNESSLSFLTPYGVCLLSVTGQSNQNNIHMITGGYTNFISISSNDFQTFNYPATVGGNGEIAGTYVFPLL